MSPPSGTRDEYSRKDGASRRGRGAAAVPFRGPFLPRGATAKKPSERRALAFARGLRPTLVVGTLIGAAVLIVAEFMTLYSVHAVGKSAPFQVISGGSNNSYAMIPIALVAVILALAALRGGGRWALGGLGLVGLVGLLIGLLGDLPDARRAGPVHLAGRYVQAAASPSAGMYLETLGAVILIATAGLGLLLVESVPAPGGEARPAGSDVGPAD